MFTPNKKQVNSFRIKYFSSTIFRINKIRSILYQKNGNKTIVPLYFHHTPYRHTIGKKLTKNVDAALQVGSVDFHLVAAALLAVDRCAKEVVDFHGADGFLCLNGQFVVDEIEIDDHRMDGLFAKTFSVFKMDHEIATWGGNEGECHFF